MSANIKKAVKDFFAGSRYVYATPGTGNHSANFYGGTYVCRFNQREVVSCIELARDSWSFEDEEGEPMFDDDLTQAAIDAVLDDMQHDKPKP